MENENPDISKFFTQSPPTFAAQSSVESASNANAGGTSDNAISDSKPRKRRKRKTDEPEKPPVDPARVEAIRNCYQRFGAQTVKIATSWNASRLSAKASAIGFPHADEIAKSLTMDDAEVAYFGECCAELAVIYGADPSFGPIGGLLVVSAGYIAATQRVEAQLKKFGAMQQQMQKLKEMEGNQHEQPK